MHEMSLCEGLLQVVEAEAVKQGFSKVMAVWLEVGALSSVEPEAMEFCFDAVTRDSLANGATLNIIRTPGNAWCMKCAKVVVIQRRLDPCPECDSYQLQVVSGDEVNIKELEVE